MATIAVNDQTFKTEILGAQVPVLVDFWAEWCGPCKAIAPVLEELSDTYAGRLIIAKVDVDANPMISHAMRIQSIPTMVLFSQGRPVDMVQGALPKDALIRFLEPHLPAASPELKRQIKVAELAAVLEQVTVIDIRASNDFSRSHIRHAKNIQPEALSDELAKFEGQQIVLVCRTGEQSLELVEKYEESGVKIASLEKGLLEWQGDGQPTYSNREEASLDA